LSENLKKNDFIHSFVQADGQTESVIASTALSVLHSCWLCWHAV